MTTYHNPLVQIERRFAVLPERVFDAWLDPAMIGRWMFGNEDIVRLSLDAHVGGAFSFAVRRQGKEIDHVGRYLYMRRPWRLVFTWGIAGASMEESRVSVDLLPVGMDCELTLTHELSPHWADHESRTKAGWTTMLDALETVLAAK
jgi:uncharacterized protein YndB with AHSA1/START domain